MTFLIFLAGIIIGLILAVIAFLGTKRYQVPLERKIKQLENITKEKGEVFVEDDEQVELEAFLDGLPKE